MPGRPSSPGAAAGSPAPLAVLANPAAGRGRYRGALPTVAAVLGTAGHQVQIMEATTRAAALAACHDAVRDRAAALVVLGGDGTIHLALQALAGTGVPLGVVPTGTGNDFAAGLGLAAGPAVAARRIVAALASGRTRQVDLARVETPAVTGAEVPSGVPLGAAVPGTGRWFGAVLAAGFDAAVNERANRMTLPRGPARYNLAILAELIGLRARRYWLRLDGVESEVDAVLVAVANTGRYGGGMRICPGADPADGRLDVVVGHQMGRARMIGLAPKVRSGRHLGHPLVHVAQAAVVELAADGVTGYADGERSLALPVTVRCVPGALSLLG